MGLRVEIVQLFRKAATELPQDVLVALEKAKKREGNQGSRDILDTLLKNCKQAAAELKPVCQDTGIPVVYVECPKKYSQRELTKLIQEAATIATREVPLRPNAVESLTGTNVGNVPVVHFEESKSLKIDLMLKGGGSENVSAIYSLPDSTINAHRDFDGVRVCILDAIVKAQGRGCPPYLVGIAVGGSIEKVAHLSKKQLLRKVDDTNPDKVLRTFERRVLKEINQLGIGPLGLGGKTTALSCKVTSGIRHPASFFVGISIGCWCMRRQTWVRNKETKK